LKKKFIYVLNNIYNIPLI